ncbi:radical SAM family heme chaperone HemW [Pseudobacter ginsenosidimutans]|uniref:Heme chaperone HemW n=1 Tax=Pseudobacter ginsenosidimutans TaxID=661488 RepID=A0A4Q7MTZ4_9BACT|nr:radical SAM family heme chaperone HemW [Pseudobacter ginsenosidimutans]QEC40936.1 radical SAM family heme chaperone HemW [Pseudobacter ginsenosidimutans]RZS72325.1 oxygen-independent coproporphyrinogen-3 oxidase [Pseudobacter ginsenosidimutans]
MAGIYIHIPFCRQACHYCNFHFSTSRGLENEFLNSLLAEIPLQQGFLAGETVETVYFGGGTPSLLDAESLNMILRALRENFSIHPNAEFTLEANPDDINRVSLQSWKDAGINRLSIGIQSFYEEDLRWMNRAHTATQAIDNLKLALEFFPNITIDLIYGSPGLTDEKWASNVQRVIEMGIPHISCYALTVEPKTALESMIRTHKREPVVPEDQARQFIQLMEWLKAAGYDHYEISNFALPGKRSKHNSAYWEGKKYLGLGPSAHSYDGANRQWNIANNALYIQALKNGTVPFEQETLTPVQRLNEYIMTSLRTMEGMSLEIVKRLSDASTASQLRKFSERLIREGLMNEVDDHLILTQQGKLFADGIAADLFRDEPE